MIDCFPAQEGCFSVRVLQKSFRSTWKILAIVHSQWCPENYLDVNPVAETWGTRFGPQLGITSDTAGQCGLDVQVLLYPWWFNALSKIISVTIEGIRYVWFWINDYGEGSARTIEVVRNKMSGISHVTLIDPSNCHLSIQGKTNPWWRREMALTIWMIHDWKLVHTTKWSGYYHNLNVGTSSCTMHVPYVATSKLQCQDAEALHHENWNKLFHHLAGVRGWVWSFLVKEASECWKFGFVCRVENRNSV